MANFISPQLLGNELGSASFAIDVGDGDDSYHLCPRKPWDDFYLIFRALRVNGTAGDVKVETDEGLDYTIEGVQVGEEIPIKFRKVYSTGTTATSITALV